MTTSGVTIGKIPQFTGTATVGSSVITQSGANIGIGTVAPMGPLDVNGIGGLVVSSANIGPGTTYSLIPLENSGKLLLGWNHSAGAGETDLIQNSGPGSPGGFSFFEYSNSGVLTNTFLIGGDGTISPGNSLTLTKSGSRVVFPDGTKQTTAFNPALCGADYAESVGVTGDRTRYEPGDVLVIDADAPGKFLKSAQPYSTLVAGIYSTQPGFVGRLHPANAEADKTEVPMAMVGRVPTKVSAENGPIKVGDLLVSSSKLGYAMKGTDRSLMLGAVVGKALGSLDADTGVIQVLVALQ